jgi:hypothetical protein
MEAGLKALLARDPFISFTIVLTGGSAFVVDCPYQVAIGKSQINNYYPRSDRWAILRLNQIAAFDISNRGGRRSQRRAL